MRCSTRATPCFNQSRCPQRGRLRLRRFTRATAARRSKIGAAKRHTASAATNPARLAGLGLPTRSKLSPLPETGHPVRRPRHRTASQARALIYRSAIRNRANRMRFSGLQISNRRPNGVLRKKNRNEQGVKKTRRGPTQASRADSRIRTNARLANRIFAPAAAEIAESHVRMPIRSGSAF